MNFMCCRSRLTHEIPNINCVCLCCRVHYNNFPLQDEALERVGAQKIGREPTSGHEHRVESRRGIVDENTSAREQDPSKR